MSFEMFHYFVGKKRHAVLLVKGKEDSKDPKRVLYLGELQKDS